MVIGLILAIVVGITLGLVGSGGTILTVPILVYLMGVNPILATTYSLFAIGITSFVGAVKGYREKEVDVKQVFAFGLPSLVMVFITRTFILPLVPDVIHIGPWEFEQEVLLMIIFAFVMLASAISMIKGANDDTTIIPERVNTPLSLVIGQGVFVGMVTGVVGAGGGFLIIPALINFFRMPIRRAVSTSLAIIAINSFFGVLGDLEKFAEFDWLMILTYTFLTV